MKRFVWLLLALIPLTSSCKEEIIVNTVRPVMKVTPIANFPDETGSIDVENNKVNMGETALYVGRAAVFEVKNIGQAPMKIEKIKCTSDGAAQFIPSPQKYYTDSIVPGSKEDNRIVIHYYPQDEWSDNNGSGQVEDGELDHGTCIVESNASNSPVTLQITGYGVDKGYPDLKVCFDTYCGPDDIIECHTCNDNALEEECAGQTGLVCVTRTMEFGNVGLCPQKATQFMTIKNIASCPRKEGVGICDDESLCQVSVNDVQFYSYFRGDITHHFSINGSTTLPVYLNQPEFTANRCEPQGVSDIQIPIVYDASCTETEETERLIIKSNDPLNPTIVVPMTASSKEGPVAVCTFRTGEGYTDTNNFAPLNRVYLDGSHSRAPNAREDAINNGIIRYEWRVIRYPDGANTNDFAPVQTGPYYDFYLPIAGEYQVALTVYDDSNTASASTEQSVCTIPVVPASKLHIQLVWDDMTNDQDLHLLYIDKSNKLCAQDADCYWSLRDPVWFSEDAKGENGNPRLDKDDTNGMGPENINIDKPRPGTYRVFVQYFAPLSGGADTRNTVRIYINGLQQAEYHRTLTAARQMWAVADIIWDEAGNGKVVPLDSDVNGETGWLCNNISCDTNNVCEYNPQRP